MTAWPRRLAFAIGIAGCGGGEAATQSPVVVEPPAIHTVRMTGDPPSATATAPLVACRDGDLAWQRLEPVGGVYSCAVASRRYTVLTACRSGGLSMVHLLHRTVADGAPPSLGHCAIVTAPVMLRGVIPGTGENGAAFADGAVGHAAADGEFALAVGPGLRDVVLMRGDRIAIVRNVVVDGSGDVEIAGAIAAATSVKIEFVPITVVGTDADDAVLLYSRLTTVNQTTVTLLGDREPPFVVMALPDEALVASDRFAFVVRADAPDGSVRTTSGASRELALPPRLAPSTVTVAAGAPVRLAFRWPARDGVDEWTLSMSQDHDGKRTRWYADLTPAWFDAAAEHAYQFPAVAFDGWMVDAELVPGADVAWRMVAREGHDGDVPSRHAVRGGVLSP